MHFYQDRVCLTKHGKIDCVENFQLAAVQGYLFESVVKGQVGISPFGDYSLVQQLKRIGTV